jgi:DNA-binding GntR family transcriptional regulator
MVRNAIAAGEPQRAGALMAEHILQGRDSLLELRSQPGCETETHAS